MKETQNELPNHTFFELHEVLEHPIGGGRIDAQRGQVLRRHLGTGVEGEEVGLGGGQLRTPGS
jgi:hypothetical protein